MKTDTQLQQDVLAELKWEPSIDAAQIGVEVKDGVVTLAGNVDSYAAKWDAERAAQRVSGVKALAVEMDVQLSGGSQRLDADIARSAESVLAWMSHVPSDQVHVMVEKGWITLTGQVEWAYQRDAATGAVRYLMGVTGVSDQITVKPRVSVTAVKADIEAALKRRATADSQHITVSVVDGDVTLTGSVHSWSERDLARNSAWGSPGVRPRHRPDDRRLLTVPGPGGTPSGPTVFRSARWSTCDATPNDTAPTASAGCGRRCWAPTTASFRPPACWWAWRPRVPATAAWC